MTRTDQKPTHADNRQPRKEATAVGTVVSRTASTDVNGASLESSLAQRSGDAI